MSDALAKLNARTKRLPGYCYKLEDKDGFAFDVMSARTLEFDEGRMCVKIPYADGNNRDGVGDLLEVVGIDHSRHRKNPICGFDHFKKVDLPIGMAEDPDTREYTTIIDEVAKTADDWCFMYQGKENSIAGKSLGDKTYDHGVFCEQLFHMVTKGMVRGGSLGYQIKEARELPPDYAKGLPEGYHLLKTLKLESSLVVLPANQDTVAKMLFGNRRMCGKPISFYLIKAIKPFAPPKKVQLGYEPGRKALDAQGGEKPKVSSHSLRLADFITLPKGVKGTNCSNCEYNQDGVCQKQEIKGQPVTPRNCCSFWDAPGTLRNWRSRELADYQKKYITHEGSEYVVHAESGKVLGKHPTKEKAEAQLRAVEANKHGKGLPKPTVKELREKYRKAKKLRRRLRKSRAGSSLVHVEGKDLEKLKEEAKEKGVTLNRMGEKNGFEKVKLTGDDSVIDCLAQKYGKRVKGLEGSMTREIQRKVKAAPPLDPADPANNPAAMKPIDKAVDNDAETPAEESQEETGEENEEEKYSLQVLRRMHEDATLLLEQYEDLRGPLEHEAIHAHMEKKLQNLVEELEEIEVLCQTHHPEAVKAKPLENMGEGMEEPVNPEEGEAPERAPSESGEEEEEAAEEEAEMPKGEEEGEENNEEEEPTGEEALEGMERGMKKPKAKSLRKKYKSLPATKKKGLKEEEEEKGMEEEEEEKGFDDKEQEEHGTELDEDDRHRLTKAHEFIKSLSEKEALEETDKLEAYHHHKNLDEMAGGDSVEGGDGEKSMGEHCESIKAASDYLKRMCHEKNFGEPHRQEALEHLKALEPHVLKDGDPDMLEDEEHHEEEDEDPEHEDVVGELDEKEFPHEDQNEWITQHGKVNLKGGKKEPGENSLKKGLTQEEQVKRLKDESKQQSKTIRSLASRVKELTSKLV